MIINVCSIVEGKGEVAAVPILLRRIHKLVKPDIVLNILPPIQVKRHKVIKSGELERYIELAIRISKAPRILFVLLDSDDDPPCILGPNLLSRGRAARSDIALSVVLAKREFESWFLSALQSLQGCCGLAEKLPSINSAENIRDAKGMLTKYMKGSRAYSPVLDQAKLTMIFDMEIARQNSDSFDKCWRETERLIIEAAKQID